MNIAINLFQTNNTVKKIIKENKNSLIINSTANTNALLIASLFYEKKKTIFYIAENIYKASLMYDNLCNLVGLENVNFYVADEIVATELLASSGAFLQERTFTTNSLILDEVKIIVTHTLAVLRPLLPKELIKNYVISLSKGMNIDLKDLTKTLTEAGYRRTPLTQVVGEFSLRGSIIDIFPINYDYPLRIDLFDTEIEDIKDFDPESQKTNKQINEIMIFPISELVYDHPENIISKIKEDLLSDENYNIKQDLEDLLNYNNLERLHKYIKYINPNLENILDYVEDKIVLYDEVKRIEQVYLNLHQELKHYLEDKRVPKSLDLVYYNELSSVFSSKQQTILLSQFRQSFPNLLVKVDEVYDLKAYLIIDYANDIKSFIFDLKAKDKLIVLSYSSPEVLALFSEILKTNNINYRLCRSLNDLNKNNINLIAADFSLSFAFIDELEFISEASIFKKFRTKKTTYRSAYQEGSPLSKTEDLSIGDYIVHYDYGIAQYLGIKTIELQKIKNDYIVLKFANIEMYIPVENINLLERYLGTEGSSPKLTTVGSKEWSNRKAKVKKKLLDIARDLIKTQALRGELSGYKYSEDDDIQKEFEADFIYNETADQLKTVAEIKADMEEGKIIDRLICGDVGYGKTEVAMRIAMKTVLSGAQVAYLAPTTILSRQHYLNFLERFSSYGVEVALLNRMVEASVQKEVIEKVKEGQIDILIGTHRLLSDEINFKNLRLLIVDEEQRFGVSHKEKIRQLKHNINVLTLSATPIPRTLQMSLMGVRQLSLIETAPKNRYPIQTYVLEYNANIIKEAIYRELGRGGQVFYLHNRISDLNRIYRTLTKLVPEAKILMVHGKMDRNQLEDAISSFVAYEYDVLICTTIIETGIDIPNTNTLIISMADRFGLAQMYQIRGRVGRSDRVSYAYFMFDENKVLTEASIKRLNAIKEFTMLGSGYKIAIRDLAIRGAGDILGKEQSGFIDSIGLDLYMKLLSDAMNEVKGIKTDEEAIKNWQIEIPKHVAPTYVSDDEVKIYIHKQIASISSKEEKDNLYNELLDRFGSLTEDIKTYIDKKYLDVLLNKIAINNVLEKENFVRFSLSEELSKITNGTNLFSEALKIDETIKLEYKGRRIHIFIYKNKLNYQWLKSAISLFSKLVENVNDFFFNNLKKS